MHKGYVSPSHAGDNLIIHYTNYSNIKTFAFNLWLASLLDFILSLLMYLGDIFNNITIATRGRFLLQKLASYAEDKLAKF